MNVADLIAVLTTYDPALMVCVPDGADADYREILALAVRRIQMINEDDGSEIPMDCLVLEG